MRDTWENVCMYNIPLQNCLIYREQSFKNQGWFYKTLDQYSSKTIKVMKNKESENCPRPNLTKETWGLNVIWYPELNPDKQRRTLVEKLGKADESLEFV